MISIGATTVLTVQAVDILLQHGRQALWWWIQRTLARPHQRKCTTWFVDSVDGPPGMLASKTKPWVGFNWFLAVTFMLGLHHSKTVAFKLCFVH